MINRDRATLSCFRYRHRFVQRSCFYLTTNLTNLTINTIPHDSTVLFCLTQTPQTFAESRITSLAFPIRMAALAQRVRLLRIRV